MSEWNTIGSAPQDGTSVWIGHDSGLMVPAFFRTTIADRGYWVELYSGLPVQWRPMFWQPLPKPPLSPEPVTPPKQGS